MSSDDENEDQVMRADRVEDALDRVGGGEDGGTAG